MKKFPNTSHIDPSSLDGLNHLGKFLDDVQFLSGAIPSNQDGSHDPWDHLGAVRGLSTLGLKNQALNGLHWMVANQNEDGSWYNLYQDEKPLELNKQTNYASYIAVAVWHFYLLNNDVNFLQDFWEPVKKGILFTLSLQHRNGAMAWNIAKSKKTDEEYLLTGCSSIAKSLECAIAICQVLEHENFESEWRDAHSKLIAALENPAEIFDLKKDPHELNDLGADSAYQNIIDIMYQRLGRWSLRMSQRTTIDDEAIEKKQSSNSDVGIILGVYDDNEISDRSSSFYKGLAKGRYSSQN